MRLGAVRVFVGHDQLRVAPLGELSDHPAPKRLGAVVGRHLPDFPWSWMAGQHELRQAAARTGTTSGCERALR